MDLANHIPGLSLMSRGDWSCYLSGSGDAVRDLAANGGDSDWTSNDGCDEDDTRDVGLAASEDDTRDESESGDRKGGRGGKENSSSTAPPPPTAGARRGGRRHCPKGWEFLDEQVEEELGGADPAADAAAPQTRSGAKRVYEGVSWHSGRGSWEVQVMINGISMRSGNFATAEEAARSYDTEVLRRGSDIRLNFPEEHGLPPNSATAQESFKGSEGRGLLGVRPSSASAGKWDVELRVDGERLRLGRVAKKAQAARLHDSFAAKVGCGAPFAPPLGSTCNSHVGPCRCRAGSSTSRGRRWRRTAGREGRRGKSAWGSRRREPGARRVGMRRWGKRP